MFSLKLPAGFQATAVVLDLITSGFCSGNVNLRQAVLRVGASGRFGTASTLPAGNATPRPLDFPPSVDRQVIAARFRLPANAREPAVQ